MKKYSIILIFVLAIAGLQCFAQTSQPTITDDFKPLVCSCFALLSGGLYKPEEIKDKSKVKLSFSTKTITHHRLKLLQTG